MYGSPEPKEHGHVGEIEFHNVHHGEVLMKFSGMVVGVPKEIMPGEDRVAAIPDIVWKITNAVFGDENMSSIEMSGLVEPFQRIHLLNSIVNISTETKTDGRQIGRA